MKTSLFLAAALAGGALAAQNVQDFRYVTLAPLQKDFINNKYGLTTQLEDTFRKKNYTVLPAEQSAWPADAAQNPCSVLNAGLLNSSSFLKNKISVELKDCHDKKLANYTGSSAEKEYEVGYPEALAKALATLPVSAPKEIAPEPAQGDKSRDVTTMPMPVEAEKLRAEPINPQNAQAEIFSDGRNSLQRIQLSGRQFILVAPNTSVPFATFSESGRPGIYHVKTAGGGTGIGYFEHKNLIIETANADGSLQKSSFSRK